MQLTGQCVPYSTERPSFSRHFRHNLAYSENSDVIIQVFRLFCSKENREGGTFFQVGGWLVHWSGVGGGGFIPPASRFRRPWNRIAGMEIQVFRNVDTSPTPPHPPPKKSLKSFPLFLFLTDPKPNAPKDENKINDSELKLVSSDPFIFLQESFVGVLCQMMWSPRPRPPCVSGSSRTPSLERKVSNLTGLPVLLGVRLFVAV